MDLFYRFIKTRVAVHRFRVREHMNEEKHTQRNDARDLVQLSQEKRVRKFYRHLRNVARRIEICLCDCLNFNSNSKIRQCSASAIYTMPNIR